MISFASDYLCGAHPQVLKRLVETNMEVLGGYGSDLYCQSAAAKIQAACACPKAEIYFLTGGTQTNQLIISAMLKSYEGVIAAKTGHISVHEAGAIEYTGHKVLELEGELGKLKADDLEDYIKTFFADENHEHMVFPGMVYISFPTEYGTLYSKKELEALAAVCHRHAIPLYIDGARLGYGLCSYENDLSLPEMAALCDVFYIGGTKVGALCGEAVVFPQGNPPQHLRTQIKQHGALLAKGRLLGVQFDALFTNDLYWHISQHAIAMAEKLKKILMAKGYEFFLQSSTNQQFVILDHKTMERLSSQVEFSFWEELDEDRSVVRFATSWSTKEEDLKVLEKLL
ncbi:low specificity L-threonine aldolase [Clostridiales bacterium COT073_COT-073]|nr:low specificity L-threonine aldolase [Clostridiales bacterium COT073_COT-073]